jgi:hypothetical protein
MSTSTMMQIRKVYVALAEVFDCVLLTCDGRLAMRRTRSFRGW